MRRFVDIYRRTYKGDRWRVEDTVREVLRYDRSDLVLDMIKSGRRVISSSQKRRMMKHYKQLKVAETLYVV